MAYKMAYYENRIRIQGDRSAVVFLKEDFVLAHLTIGEDSCSITIYIRGDFKHVITYSPNEKDAAWKDFEAIYNAIGKRAE